MTHSFNLPIISDPAASSGSPGLIITMCIFIGVFICFVMDNITRILRNPDQTYSGNFGYGTYEPSLWALGGSFLMACLGLSILLNSASTLETFSEESETAHTDIEEKALDQAHALIQNIGYEQNGNYHWDEDAGILEVSDSKGLRCNFNAKIFPANEHHIGRVDLIEREDQCDENFHLVKIWP